jgi:hypothetical protein
MFEEIKAGKDWIEQTIHTLAIELKKTIHLTWKAPAWEQDTGRGIGKVGPANYVLVMTVDGREVRDKFDEDELMDLMDTPEIQKEVRSRLQEILSQ